MTEHGHMHLSISANVGGGGGISCYGSFVLLQADKFCSLALHGRAEGGQDFEHMHLVRWQALEFVASALTAHISQLMFRFFSSGGSQATRSACDFESVAWPASTRSKSS